MERERERERERKRERERLIGNTCACDGLKGNVKIGSHYVCVAFFLCMFAM